MTNKFAKVATIAALVILAVVFITSGTFAWMLVGFFLPVLAKFVDKKGYLSTTKISLAGMNAYRYSLYVLIALALIRLIFSAGWFFCLIGELLGLGLSYMLFEKTDIKK